jgi:hypothetical protein
VKKRVEDIVVLGNYQLWIQRLGKRDASGHKLRSRVQYRSGLVRKVWIAGEKVSAEKKTVRLAKKSTVTHSVTWEVYHPKPPEERQNLRILDGNVYSGRRADPHQASS